MACARSRHAKNNTASSYFTYHERQKLKYGTQKQRVGRDSLPDFDWCNLSLAPAVQPVVTPSGYVYSKEAIYENLLLQKKENEKKKRLWEEQQKRILEDALRKEEEHKLAEVEKFVKTESAVGTPLPEKARKRNTTESAEMEELKVKVREHAKNLRAYWVPGKTPTAAESVLPQPSSKTYCPMSNEPLRLKELLPIEFTPVQNINARDAEKVGKWMCPVCSTIFSNRTKLTVLRTSGKVMCHGCYHKFGVPDMKDPTNGKRIREKDVIHLKSPGTGFAAKAESASLVATKVGVAFVG